MDEEKIIKDLERAHAKYLHKNFDDDMIVISVCLATVETYCASCKDDLIKEGICYVTSKALDRMKNNS